uniref:NB-ARC domain-containing protein n=1 Tax=Physcomitrium patens TaxID=3218 RepID=A0A2K1JMI1_PHYPA|nr:hypothetical protein PHYPA_017569 [Physcomitrium patens]
MPSGHSKEHLMTAVEGIPNPNQRLMELSFAKPVSPQWAYRVDDMGVPLFRWSQRQHLANTLMKTVKDFEALQRDALPTATTSKEELSDSVVWTEGSGIEKNTKLLHYSAIMQVLGVRVGPVAQEWQKFDFKQYTKENIHPIFSILRSGYDALRPLYQRMFIDLAVYQADWTSHAYFYNVWRYVHGERDEDALVKLLKELLVKSLIEHCDLNSGKVYIHDLCRDFIQMEVESEVKHNPRCYLFQTNNQRYFQACRLRIQHQGITELTEGILCTCSKAELLSLEECDYLRLVDVRGMSNLALLQINKCPQLTSIFVEGVKTLRSISWDGFQGDYPSLTGSESLESLELKSNKDWPNIPPTNSDLSYCCNLENLHLSNIPLSQEMANINSLVKLRRLSIGNCQQLKRVYGLEAAKFIQVIVLEGCSSLLEFPSLVNFRFLQYFVLSNATVLKKLHGISGFSLTHLLLRNATQLEDLLGIQAFTTLKYLNLSNTGIEDFSWISNMKELRVINLSGTRLKILPNHKHLHKLEELQLNNCVALEDLDKDFDISPSLREFRMWNCPNLKTLPQFKISSLIYLCICDAKVEDISEMSIVDKIGQCEELTGTRDSYGESALKSMLRY